MAKSIFIALAPASQSEFDAKIKGRALLARETG
jgi:hypothetical protein